MVDFKPVTNDLNSSSFKANGNFKGRTDWRENTYTKNNYNSDIIFDENKDMTIKVTKRYNQDGTDAKQSTGIAFDVLNIFIDAAADGKLKDIDGQGFTKEDMTSFGNAFDKLQKEKASLKPYNKKYTKLQDRTTFNFSADEIKYLYEAAGFSLVEQKAIEHTHATNHQPDAQVQQAKKDNISPITAQIFETKSEIKIPETFTVGTDKEIKSENMETVLNTIVENLGVTDAKQIHIDFGGKEIDDNGNITKAIHFTYNNEQYVIQQGNVNNLKLVKMPPAEYTRDGVKYESRYNEESGQIEERKAGKTLGLNLHKWQSYDCEAAMQKNQNKDVVSTEKEEASNTEKVDAKIAKEAEKAAEKQAKAEAKQAEEQTKAAEKAAREAEKAAKSEEKEKAKKTKEAEKLEKQNAKLQMERKKAALKAAKRIQKANARNKKESEKANKRIQKANAKATKNAQEVAAKAKPPVHKMTTEEKLAAAYKKYIVDAPYWVGFQKLDNKLFNDPNNRIIYEYRKVTTANGQRILKVTRANADNAEDTDTKYYLPTVKETQQNYIQIIPDLTKELENVILK